MKFLFLSLVAVAALASSSDVISTFAGGGPSNMPATRANVQYPVATAVDSSGDFYYVDTWSHQAFEINASGTIIRLAGSGFPGYNGSGGLAVNAELNYPQGIAVDPSKNVYIADELNCVIRKITAGSGIITVVAGTPQSCGYGGDGSAATSAQLNRPTGIAVDSSGNLYIADWSNYRIRKVTASTGKITTVAGNGTDGFSGDGGAATSAELNAPLQVALDGSGNIYIDDYYDLRIREVTASTGKIATIAGNGTAGFSGDGGAATSAEINYVQGIASDSAGNVFIADTVNCIIREVTKSTGKINTVAGKGQACGFSGDGSAATSAELNAPYGIAVNSSGAMYIADYNNFRIREATPGGDITTVAGSGALTYAGNGSPANGATLDGPTGATPDASGNVYIADAYNCVVRRVNSSGMITTIAGVAPTGLSSNCGYNGDGIPAASAELYNPVKAIADSSGNVYIADTANCLVRKVTASTGKISTYAGNASQGCGYSGDGGQATSAQLYDPYGLTFDGSGNLYVADFSNNRVRKVTPGGIISTVAGNGTGGYSGDGGLAASAELQYPSDVAYDSFTGKLYIVDDDNNRVRVVSSGIIDTYAGNGNCTYNGDKERAVESALCYPGGVAVDSAGDVLIGDEGNQRVRWVNGEGIIQTLAGSGDAGFSGDGEVATISCPSGSPATCVPVNLYNPWGVGVDPSGNLYIADENSNRIREVTAIPNANAYPSALSFPDQALGSTGDPQTVTIRTVGPLNIYSINVTGNFEEADDCPSSLSGGATCEIDITFTPGVAGKQTGALTVSTNNHFGNLLSVGLSGSGTGLAYAPTLVNFGNQSVNTTSSAHTVTFTNDTTTAVTFTSASVNKTQFKMASNTCTGSLATGKSCAVSVTFTPIASGLLTGTLEVQDSDSSSPQLIPLRGTGITTSASAGSKN